MAKIRNAFFSVLTIIVISALMLTCATPVLAAGEDGKPSLALAGSGTREDPYLIGSYEDLCYFRDCVNGGSTFYDTFFLQTANIDMGDEPWTPIGKYVSPFCGVYDGGGHYVENLLITYESSTNGYSGFFGFLGGTVVNFGVESGMIYGERCGSVAASSYGVKAAILNCYSKATLCGTNTGGIADVFSGNGNAIACCWFDGQTYAAGSTGLLSSGGEVKVYHTYTTESIVAASSDVYTPTSASITKDLLYSDAFIQKLNLSAALSQYLFGTYRQVELMQWGLDSEGNIVFTQDKGYMNAFGFVNSYFLPVVLLLILCGYAIAFAIAGKGNIWRRYHKDIKAIAIISGIVALFVDTAIAGKGLSYLTPGNFLFTVMINGIFLGTVIAICRCAFHRNIARARIPVSGAIKTYLPILSAIVVVLILELLQFDVVPKFDGGIYYGSLVRAVDLFQIDFLTYIGAFVCWKWAHGLVLLIAPLEFLFPGQMFGVYIANMAITAVTMWCMYWLLRQISPKITPVLATFGSLILVLCPYQLGMFTYLCMDGHTAYFLVWLLCSYKKKNPLLVAFCGYLLAFNKVSGLVFYVFFLLTMGLFEMLETNGRTIFHKIINWWDWKKVILWVAPAVIYLASMVLADDLTIQNFYGSYTEASIGLKEGRALANTFLQGFVYGFRWVFVLVLLAAVVLLLFRVRKMSSAATKEGTQILVASAMGCLSVLAVLCLYRGDAECPRYTALFNLFFALSFPLMIQLLSSKKSMQHILGGAMVVLLLVQTYWTIDPVLILTSESIDSGKKQIYKLALPGDERLGMSLGTNFGLGYEVYGDLYSYNYEHVFYDDLLDQAFAQIQPESDTQLLLLDVIYYELHVSGNRYPIYWNTRTEHRTYDGTDPDSIYLENHYEVTTRSICNGEIHLDSVFYLLVPARVDESEAIAYIEQQGYEMITQLHPENTYGCMSVYGFQQKVGK